MRNLNSEIWELNMKKKNNECKGDITNNTVKETVRWKMSIGGESENK